MRVGPAGDYKISWVYRRKHLPLKVVRLKEGWRLVEDPDGAKGWILSRFLTRERGAMGEGQGPAEMREKGDGDSPPLWRLRAGGTRHACDVAGGRVPSVIQRAPALVP